jgi:hypothetical protein
LPSGLVVELSRSATATASSTFQSTIDAFGGDSPSLVARHNGAFVDINTLSLEDFHVLRALATHEGWIDEKPVEAVCRNCKRSHEVRPSRELEIGPFVDGELDDPDLDAPFDFSDSLPIAPIKLGAAGRDATTLKLVPRTVAEARPLLEAIDRDVLRLTSKEVIAMGIASLGDERSPVRIARALQRASDEAWASVIDHFDAAHYTARLRAWVTCDECGARIEVDAPTLREFPLDPRGPSDEQEADLARGFPSLGRFEEIVANEATEALRKAGVDRAEISLLVVSEVADCDDGGVALLGSYMPPIEEGHAQIAQLPEIRLYYRTFRAMYVDEGPYDVGAEIRETLEHELEHHRAFLEGDDPMDRDERETLEREKRRQVGERESLRRASRDTRAGLGDFLRRTWPLWALIAGITWWAATR